MMSIVFFLIGAFSWAAMGAVIGYCLASSSFIRAETRAIIKDIDRLNAEIEAKIANVEDKKI